MKTGKRRERGRVSRVIIGNTAGRCASSMATNDAQHNILQGNKEIGLHIFIPSPIGDSQEIGLPVNP